MPNANPACAVRNPSISQSSFTVLFSQDYQYRYLPVPLVLYSNTAVLDPSRYLNLNIDLVSFVLILRIKGNLFSSVRLASEAILISSNSPLWQASLVENTPTRSPIKGPKE